MIAPVWEDALLDLLVQALLHAVHELKLVGLEPTILISLTPRDGLLQRAGGHA